SPRPSLTTTTMNLDTTLATQEAHHILNHLLTKLQDPTNTFSPRYASYLHRTPTLPTVLTTSLRPAVLTFLSTGNWTVNSMQSIGGDTTSKQPLIYLHSIRGTDNRTRVYIGQTTDFPKRKSAHAYFRHRRDNPSLHYHAVQRSAYDAWAVLVVLPRGAGGEEGQLLLNVAEMWMCLVLRALPREVLEEWLPEGVEVLGGREEAGLNVGNPLGQGGKGGMLGGWVDLRRSGDPLVVEYARERERSVVQDVRGEGREERLVAPGTLVLTFGLGVLVGWMVFRASAGGMGRLSSGLR
ncbi:hypothetical protein EJ04DRAFT_425599, partial [Polyplosphaeria fusca]